MSNSNAIKTLTLLIVDDDEDDRYHLSRLMRDIPDWDVELLEAPNRHHGIATAKATALDAIILDYRLGAESGLEFLQELQAQELDVPVVVTTGQGDERIATQFMQHGASDYLIKGELSPHTLHRALDRAIAQASLRKEKALLEEQVQQLQKMDAISTLAGGLAHDFNNILTGIVGHVQLAQMAKNGNLQDHLEAIERDCRRMADLLRRLLSLKEPAAALRVRLVNLAMVLQEFKLVLEHAVPPGIRLEILPGEDELMVQAQVPALHQILMSICANAIEAMEETGVLTIALRRDERAAVDSGSTRMYGAIDVIDTGRGIAPENLTRIFEPFYTTKPLTSVKGSGLSLALVWHSVTSMGGTVRVASEVGKGTTVTLSFPLAD